MAEEEESVQVAVRVRCFNKRELEANSPRIIRMQRLLKGSNTYIKNVETGEERKYDFDYSFQSHSQTEAGIGDWASQDTVFEDLGRPVMESSLEGRNVCLFAYGQTGAGKSYSMLGKSDDPGIIPRTCNAIFSMISANSQPAIEYTVDIQVVEIYCEQINDLLADRKQWPQGGYKPRLTTDKGYVVDTIRKPCFQYSDIESAFKFADQNRSVGSHALNPESSRAHTIYTINYERKMRHESGKIMEAISARLNLVDLAGSERTDLAGTSGQMLKEGNAINLSLTALGGCIKSLAEHKKPNFRDSKLTLLLQASMTNGKVVMIAALSPAAICYDESMSTLRFAERIKQVKIKASKNVTTDPVAEMKAAMEELRNKMQSELDALRAKAAGSADPQVMNELQQRLKEQEEERQSMREEYERKLKELDETAEDRMARAEEINSMQQSALGGASLLSRDKIKDPHLLNLHEDPRLASTLVYPFKPGETLIGRTNKDNPPTLEFNGMGIIKNHAVVVYKDDKVILKPGNHSRTLVNGKSVESPIELKHNMRVWLGNNYAFRFCFPGKESEGETFAEGPDYYFAEQEIAENQSFEMSGGEGIPAALNHKLSEALKKVEQANIISVDLGKRCEFEPKIYKNRLNGENDILVKVHSPQGELFWPWDKFNARIVEFSKEWQLWQHCEESGQKYKMEDGKEDPFIDNEYQLIGEADVWLTSLANMIEHQSDPTVLTLLGKCEGRMHIDLCPCDKNGREGPWDDDEENDPFVDDPSLLLDEDIRFFIKVHDIVFDTNVHEGSQCKWSNTWITYKVNLKDNDEQWSRTEEVSECTFNPKYNYKKEHRLRVDQGILALLTKGRMVFQIWGKLSSTTEGANVLPGKKGELVKVENDITDKRKALAELDRQIEEKRRELAHK